MSNDSSTRVGCSENVSVVGVKVLEKFRIEIVVMEHAVIEEGNSYGQEVSSASPRSRK